MTVLDANTIDDWEPCLCLHPRWTHQELFATDAQYGTCTACPCPAYNPPSEEAGLDPEAQTHRDA